MTNKKSIPLKDLRDKERLTPDEYRRLRLSEPGWSRPMVITERSEEIEKHRSALEQRDFNVELLLDVLRSSPSDPESQDFGSKRLDEIVDDLSNQLIEIVAEDKALKNSQAHANARSGATLPDSVINEIALALIEHLASDLPMGLLSLLQIRLGPKLASPTPREYTDDQRAQALLAVARNPSISTRELARVAGVNQSTASRWKNDPEFMRYATRINVPR